MGQTTVPDSQTLDQLRSKEKQKEKAIDDNQNRVAYRAPIIREQVPAYQFSENKLQGNKISAKDEIEGHNGERKTTKKDISFDASPCAASVPRKISHA